MQFIKELQKTKSLKSLQHQQEISSGHLGLKKQAAGGMHPTSKSYADNLKQLAGKSLAQRP